jgi:hypothetical protein
VRGGEEDIILGEFGCWLNEWMGRSSSSSWVEVWLANSEERVCRDSGIVAASETKD